MSEGLKDAMFNGIADAVFQSLLHDIPWYHKTKHEDKVRFQVQALIGRMSFDDAEHDRIVKEVETKYAERSKSIEQDCLARIVAFSKKNDDDRVLDRNGSFNEINNNTDAK